MGKTWHVDSEKLHEKKPKENRRIAHREKFDYKEEIDEQRAEEREKTR
jgi:hypothetical protein